MTIVTRRWIQVDTDLKIPRLTHSATLVGSYIFIFGGHNSRKYSQDILLFNLGNDGFSFFSIEFN